MAKNHIKRALLFFILLNFFYISYSQKPDSTKVINYFGGGITVTNNGISLIPTFSIDKPAVLFDLTAGRGKLSFEPQFRFSLEGKPWTFFFWWRYKLVNTSKLFIRVGVHESLSYSTMPVEINGVSKETITTQRYLAGEFTPNYFLTRNISIGMYYLYSYGIDNEYVRNTHYCLLNLNISNIKLSDKFFLSYMPLIYYLRINKNDGFNVTSTLNLARKNFPVFFSIFGNKTINSNVPGHKDFVWNASLIYSFKHNYVKAQ
ncbi:MAG: hypothetical protein ABR927_06350 [Bacteroidales bacterium]|jgi:hypothetical protein